MNLPHERGRRTVEPTGATTPFAARVLQVVADSGAGEVLTYGEVAAEAGRPGAARAVGTVLRRHGRQVPWWRVVSSRGRLVPGAEAAQAALLRAEGVPVRDGQVAPPSAR